MRPFRAPRSREGKTAAKASPTRRSPRRTDKPYQTDTTQQDTEDTEGPTELRVTRWVIPETQFVEEDNTDNKSDTQNDRDGVGGNATSLDAPSPSVSEFEHYLETQVSNQQQNKDEGSSRKKQSNDEFWEGVLQSELKRVAALKTHIWFLLKR